ncbi:MAG TPA: MFS transporter [Rugosimonospora sp.]|nr:MFS transporter [Rugosimonospora sp.]
MTGTEERLTARRLYTTPDYRLWWLGNVASSVGSRTSAVAVPIVVLALTRSARQASLVAAVEAVPFLLLSLPVGVLVDRFSRKALMTGASLVSMLAVAAIPAAYTGHALTVGLIYAAAAVNGTAAVVFETAQAASLPAVVDAERLGAASGQAEMIWGISAVLGPPLAGLLLEVSIAAPFILDAASFLVVAVVILAIRARLGPRRPLPPVVWRQDLTAGVRELLSRPKLRSITGLTLLGDLLFAGISLLMIVLVQRGGGSAATVGLVFSGAAVGGIVGSAVANRLERRLGLVTLVVAKHWLTALAFPLLALGLPAVAVAAVWAFVNLLVSVLNVVQMRYLLAVVPPETLGRVQGVTNFLSFGSLPLGLAATGFVLDALGGPDTVLVVSAVLVLIALYCSASRAIRAKEEM